MSAEVLQISRNSYYLQEREALVVFGSEPNANAGKIASVQPKNLKKNIEVKFWGEKNQLPQERELLVSENNIVGSLIGTKRDITLGGGIMAFKERYESQGAGKGTRRIVDEIEMPTYAEDFFDESSIDDYFLQATGDLMFHTNVFTEFVSNLGGKIKSIRHQRALFMRAEKQDKTGFINNYFRSAWWQKIQDKDAMCDIIPNYIAAEELQDKFMLHCGDSMLTDGYYNMPTWWGSKTWIELANAIAVFHKSNLRNGFVIRYIVEVDENYFKDNTAERQTPEQIAESQGREDSARREMTDTINSVLAGEENAGRAIFSEMRTNIQNGQQYSNIKITPINADLKDEAMLRLFEASNTANISAQAIHPNLAAIETAGKLSSGSEIRNAFLMYLAIKTPLPRKILLKPIELVKKINGWDKTVKFGFRDIELTALSENPTGAKDSHLVK
jgi:hypothetical protein